MEHRIIMFDGVCNFCSSSVQFIIKRDPAGQFQFTSLQSDTGQKLFVQYGIPKGIDSMILLENGKAYWKSTAALRIARRLSGLWKLCFGLIIVPRFLRNMVYDWIAKNRYKWFGKKESCMVPTEDIRNRFL